MLQEEENGDIEENQPPPPPQDPPPPPPPPAVVEAQQLLAALQNAVQAIQGLVPAPGPAAGGPAAHLPGAAAGGPGVIPGGAAAAPLLLPGGAVPPAQGDGNPAAPAAPEAGHVGPGPAPAVGPAALLQRIAEGPRVQQPPAPLPPAPLTAAQRVDNLIGARAPVRDPAFPADANPGAVVPPRGVAKVQPYEEVDTTTWTEWKTNWLRMARIYQWDDLTQIDTIKNYFRGEALRRVVGVFPQAGDNILDYLQKLEQVLVPVASSSEARSEYHTLAQHPKETAVAYRGRAILLFRRAYPERAYETDTEFLFRFVQGIWSDPIRRHMLLNFPTNITEAYEKMAQSGQFVVELQNDKARSTLHTTTRASIQAIGSNSSQGRGNSTFGNQRSAADIREEDKRKEQCFHCHKPGHSVSECRMKARKEQNQCGSPNQNKGYNQGRRSVGAIDDNQGDGDTDPDRDAYPDDDDDDSDEDDDPTSAPAEQTGN